MYREGRRISSGQIQIIFAPGSGATPRIGLAIAKRILPRAVDRNRVKRLVRESFRHQAAELPLLDVVISLRGRKQRGAPQQLSATLNSLWPRLESF